MSYRAWWNGSRLLAEMKNDWKLLACADSYCPNTKLCAAIYMGSEVSSVLNAIGLYFGGYMLSNQPAFLDNPDVEPVVTNI